MFMRAVPGIIVALILSTYFPALRAQSTNASISGRVTDPSKALIADAEITAVNAGTNFPYKIKTNVSGEYYLTNLPPGRYRLEVEKTGFRKLIESDVTLHVQDAIELNFELTLGSAAETITVPAGAPLVETESATVSTVIDRTFVENLPLNGRSFQTLIMLTPGVVVTTTAAYDQGQFSVNGQRADANYFTVDGVSANFGVTGFPPLMQSAGGGLPTLSALGEPTVLCLSMTCRNFASRPHHLLRSLDAHPEDRYPSRHARGQTPFMARSSITLETVCWTRTTGLRISTICLSPRSDKMTLAA